MAHTTRVALWRSHRLRNIVEDADVVRSSNAFAMRYTSTASPEVTTMRTSTTTLPVATRSRTAGVGTRSAYAMSARKATSRNDPASRPSTRCVSTKCVASLSTKGACGGGKPGGTGISGGGGDGDGTHGEDGFGGGTRTGAKGGRRGEGGGDEGVDFDGGGTVGGAAGTLGEDDDASTASPPWPPDASSNPPLPKLSSLPRTSDASSALCDSSWVIVDDANVDG